MNWITAVINGVEISISIDDTSIHVFNAFQIKEDLKGRGYRWNPADKSWFLQPQNPESELAVLQNNLQPVEVKSPGGKDTVAFPEMPDSLSVSQLQLKIQKVLQGGIGGNVWIRGVVASEVKVYEWATYFDLRDEDQKRKLFFRVEAKRPVFNQVNDKLKQSGVADQLDMDLPVLFQMAVHLANRNQVDIRLQLLDILPEYTKSKIQNEREITVEKLREEKLLDRQKKLVLPLLPDRIGLITSEMGTSVRDIMAGLHPLEDRFNFYFIDSRMEGNQAADSIVAALDYFEQNQAKNLDLIIIARGGGSEQALSVFNDYRLCRKVALCRIPVLSAIGHEKDLSALEMCSHLVLTPSTPSGMGKFLKDRILDIQRDLSLQIRTLVEKYELRQNREVEKLRLRIVDLPQVIKRSIRVIETGFSVACRQLGQTLDSRINQNEHSVNHVLKSVLDRSETQMKSAFNLVQKAMVKLDLVRRISHLETRKQELAVLLKSTQFNLNKSLSSETSRLQQSEQLIRAHDPQNVLRRGFTLTSGPDGRVIPRLGRFKDMGSAKLRFFDGETTVIDINKEDR